MILHVVTRFLPKMLAALGYEAEDDGKATAGAATDTVDAILRRLELGEIDGDEAARALSRIRSSAATD